MSARRLAGDAARGAGLLALALFFAPPAAGRERAKAPPAGDVCLAVARNWLATSAETATVATQPVPQSFRRLIRETGCSRFQLVDESLIDWHLRFGTEASTTAALAFLANEYASGGDRDGSNRDHRVELALFQVRAAEVYRSRALLEAGQSSLRRATDLETAPTARQWEQDRLARAELRSGVLRALLTRSPQDITAAEAIVRQRTTPALQALRLSSDKQDICDRGLEPDDILIRTACDEEEDFVRDALAYWEARARLAFARRGPDCAGAGEMMAVDTALALLASRIDPDSPNRGWPDYLEERMVGLLLLRAEDAARPACSESDEGGEARVALARAERLTPPPLAPARFRVIAQHYLALPQRRDDAMARYYLRLVPLLDEIAGGREADHTVTPPGPRTP